MAGISRARLRKTMEPLREVAEAYSVAVTDHLLDRMGDFGDPVALQYVPDRRELQTLPVERRDPIGDRAHSPVPGIVHRYPNRALLMPLDACAVYCRFCFRREAVGRKGLGLLDEGALGKALAYIRDTASLREIILTGGDPLILSPRRLSGLLESLAAIDHVRIARVHTRVPAAAPERVTESLCAALSVWPRPMYVVVHVNHIQELDGRNDRAFRALRQSGCILLSQSVLLRGVNDSEEALADLFQGLVERGVKPYYLHHPDLAKGTAHFRVAPERGQALMKAVRGRVSGLAMPVYVLDIPGGYGKAPIGPCHLTRASGGAYAVEDGCGRFHAYDPGLAA